MDKAHRKSDKELRALEKELDRIYTQTNKEITQRLKEKYKQQQKNDTKAIRKEIKRLEEELKRVTIEAANTNIMAKDMLQGELARVIEINDAYSYNVVLDMIEAQGLNVGFNMLNPSVVKEILKGDVFKELALDNFTDKNRIYRELRRAMSQSIIQGEGAQEMAKRIQKVMHNERYEAIRIARTETTKAQNTARNESFKDAINLGIKIKKKWHSAGDKRVRPTHAELDGVVIPYNEQFKNGCDFPGEGPASEVIMCRCTFTAEMEDY